MDFGWMGYDGLEESYFQLPVLPQPALAGRRVTSPKIYVGFPKWGYKKWVGKLYPKGTKDSQFLDQYVQHFNAIELNATHYKTYSPTEISKWAVKAAEKDFKFCPKIANSISHYSGFNNVDDKTTAFLEGVLAFGKNLGPIFIQVSDQFSPNQQVKLYSYLSSLPTDVDFFLEVRHPDFFANTGNNNQLFEKLASLNIGAVITDTISRRDVLHMRLTKPQAFIRFVCKGDAPLDFYRIQQWKQLLKEWLNNGLEQCYFFIHAHNEDESPINFAKHVQEELNSLI